MVRIHLIHYSIDCYYEWRQFQWQIVVERKAHFKPASHMLSMIAIIHDIRENKWVPDLWEACLCDTWQTGGIIKQHQPTSNGYSSNNDDDDYYNNKVCLFPATMIDIVWLWPYDNVIMLIKYSPMWHTVVGLPIRPWCKQNIVIALPRFDIRRMGVIIGGFLGAARLIEDYCTFDQLASDFSLKLKTKSLSIA